MYSRPIHLLLYLDVFENQIMLMDEHVMQSGDCLHDRICLEFCCKYQHGVSDETSVPAFLINSPH